MPNRFSSLTSRGAALLERPGTKKILLYILGTMLVVGMLAGAVSRLGRTPEEEAAPPAEEQTQTAAEPAADDASAAFRLPDPCRDPYFQKTQNFLLYFFGKCGKIIRQYFQCSD